MNRQFCPHCRAVRNMEVSVSRKRVVDSEGKVKYVRLKVLHCETCGTFVASEAAEEPEQCPGSA